MNGAAATASVESGELHVTIANGGTIPADIQVSQGAGISPVLVCVAGRNYRLQFDARADVDRTLTTSIWENGHDVDNSGFAYDTYCYTTYNITTTLSTYSVDFTMPITNYHAGLAFFCGNDTTDLYIDNVSFKEIP